MAKEKDAPTEASASESSLFEKIKNSAVIQFILKRPIVKGVVVIVLAYLLKLGGCSLYNLAEKRTVKELEQKGVISKEKRRRTVVY